MHLKSFAICTTIEMQNGTENEYKTCSSELCSRFPRNTIKLSFTNFSIYKSNVLLV